MVIRGVKGQALPGCQFKSESRMFARFVLGSVTAGAMIMPAARWNDDHLSQFKANLAQEWWCTVNV